MVAIIDVKDIIEIEGSEITIEVWLDECYRLEVSASSRGSRKEVKSNGTVLGLLAGEEVRRLASEFKSQFCRSEQEEELKRLKREVRKARHETLKVTEGLKRRLSRQEEELAVAQ